MIPFIKRFNEITLKDIPSVGGKNASLGELFNKLVPKGIKVPDGLLLLHLHLKIFLLTTHYIAPCTH